MDKPDILTTTQKNAQVQVLADEELVESHDGRKVTLVKHIYKHFDLDTQRGSPSAIIAAMNDLPLRSTCLSNWPDKANKLAVVIREHCTRVVVGLVGYGRYSAIVFGGILRDIHEKNKTDLEEDEESGSGKAKLYSLEINPLVAAVAMNPISLAGLQGIVEGIVFGFSCLTYDRSELGL